MLHEGGRDDDEARPFGALFETPLIAKWFMTESAKKKKVYPHKTPILPL
jgi:hypothetical protein